MSSFHGNVMHEIECLDIAEVISDAYSRLLPKQLAYVLKSSPFYQKKFSGISFGGDVFDARSFTELPFTEKAELLDDQAENAPFGSNLSVPLAKVNRVHKTSGTTGRPMMIALTREDVENTHAAGVRCFRAAGLGPGHLVFHCLNYCMWAGGLTDHLNLEATGAAVVPFGVGNSKGLLETMLFMKATALHCTPSYLSKLEMLLRDDFGLTPMDLGLQLGLFGAEGGLEDPNFRSRIERKWGFKAMNANYGMADVLATFGAECSARDGLHFMGQGVIHPEIIDPETGISQDLQQGAEGELVLTNLCKQAQPLVRYRTRDMIRILSTGPCSCGRSGFRFKVLGRSDDMIVVKGINVFPSTVSTVINSMHGILSGEFRILINRTPPVRRMLVRIELKPNATEGEEVRKTVASEMLAKLAFNPELEFVAAGTIPRTEGKTKRVERVLED